MNQIIGLIFNNNYYRHTIQSVKTSWAYLIINGSNFVTGDLDAKLQETKDGLIGHVVLISVA